ncbi:MAG: purine-nucleoside phosphorylase [Treponema sp.]|jgi:purine-nucleoside phosphorylase|nr:purine-nucleoside phosphorylase [Treponema sp.]MBQ5848826.1 purine-nucleoside phosphorylase [Treponema sp.]
MSTHINAPEGAIAQAILLPGDPLRAKFIAENFLENPVCYNEVRGMFGFTGTYKGKKVSVQGTGMGQPSLSIYVNELFQFYNVQTAIRVGTCGAINKNIHVRDTILANSACTDSAIITQRFGNLHYAPSANFDLLYTAYNKAKENNINVAVGPCASSDLFYDDNSNWKKWAEYGVLGVEMEAAELYTLAAKYNRKALAILTVSDHIITGEQTTAEERQVTFKDMIKIALETAINNI